VADCRQISGINPAEYNKPRPHSHVNPICRRTRKSREQSLSAYFHLHTLRANWPKDMIDVEHSHPSVFDWTVPHVCRISEPTEPVMGEGDEPLIESRSIFVANTKRIGFRVGGCKYEPNQALPMEHRDKLTSETRSLDF